MPFKVPFKLPVTPARSNQALKVSGDKEPVHVYCRLRPLETDTEKSCITIVNSTTVKVVARKARARKAGLQKTFQTASQGSRLRSFLLSHLPSF